MMHPVTEQAIATCAHQLGVVALKSGQNIVRIGGVAVLVAHDPVARPIVGCPNVGPTIKPCTATLAVRSGYSTLVCIEGKAICLETVTGLTDGTPPGMVDYAIRQPGQTLVRISA